jgi:hypothetical protein
MRPAILTETLSHTSLARPVCGRMPWPWSARRSTMPGVATVPPRPGLGGAVVSQAVVDEAVRRAAQTASPDQAPEGEVPAFAFDRSALERVNGLYRNLSTQDDVIRAWHRALKAAIHGGDLAQAQALVALQARLCGHSENRYTLTDEGMSLLPGEEPDLMDDPWIAERNYFG